MSSSYSIIFNREGSYQAEELTNCSHIRAQELRGDFSAVQALACNLLELVKLRDTPLTWVSDEQSMRSAGQGTAEARVMAKSSHLK